MLMIVAWILLWLVVALALLGGALAAFAAWTAARVEKAVPPIGSFIEVDGTRLHYLDEGEGQPIVLVHGLAAQMQHLTYGLREALKGKYRVIFVDRPGSGYSERRPGASARLPAQGDMIAALIRKLGLQRPLVVGHSLGGAVALATALDHPDCVGALALVAPLTRSQEDVPEALSRLAVPSPARRQLVAWTLAVPMTIIGGPASLAQVFAPDPIPADFGIRGGGLLGVRPKAFYAASSDMVAVIDDLDDMAARYPGLRMPVGILYGTADRILNLEVQGKPMVDLVPGLVLDVVENGGHMLPITATERTVRFIEQMAGRIDRAAPATASPAGA